MVKIIKTPQVDHISTQIFNSKANLHYYNLLTPQERITYLKNLQAVSPMEYNKIMDIQVAEQLDILEANINAIEKEIWSQSVFANIPYTQDYDETTSLYNTRASLIKQAETISRAESGRFGNPLVAQRSATNYVRQLKRGLNIDQKNIDYENTPSAVTPETTVKSMINTFTNKAMNKAINNNIKGNNEG